MISTAKIASPEALASAGTARWRVILNGKVAGNPRVRSAIGALRDRYFVNAASGGFARRSPLPRRPNSILAAKFKPYSGRLILPDREFSGASIVAIVANGRQTGGGKPVAPQALLDDGLLDVLMIGAFSAANFNRALNELLNLSPDGEFISYRQVPWVEFRPDQLMPLNLDGKPASLESPRFETVTGALRLVVPPGCALVRTAAPADA